VARVLAFIAAIGAVAPPLLANMELRCVADNGTGVLFGTTS
jgi:hypothetical protein